MADFLEQENGQTIQAKASKEEGKGKEIANIAKTYVGNPYVFGAKGQQVCAANKRIVENLAKPGTYTGDKGHYGHFLGKDKDNYGKNWAGELAQPSTSYVMIDCSGLVNTAYTAAGFSGFNRDAVNSTALHDKGQAYKVSHENARVGDVLWRSGHVGLVGENGSVIEAASWKWGVTDSKSSISEFKEVYHLSGDDKAQGSVALLSNAKITSAINYNTKNNKDICKVLQTFVGVTPTGVYDRATVEAIAKWQQKAGFTGKDVDGCFGPASKKVAGDITKAGDGADGSLDDIIYDGGTLAEVTVIGQKKPETKASNALEGAGTCKVTSKSLNLRKAPVNGTVITTLKKGDVLNLKREQNGWLEVECKGQVGWVSGKLTTYASAIKKKTADEVQRLLVKKGFSAGAVAGIMGNMEAESGMNASMTVGTAQGVDGGLCSWHASRARELAALEDWQAVSTQIDFLYYEITEKSGFKNLKNFLANPAYEKDPRKCAGAFCALFERPKSISADEKKKGQPVYLHDFQKSIDNARFTLNPYDGRYYCDLEKRLDAADKYYKEYFC